MSDIAIRVEGLSKRYRIGVRERAHDTLGGAITDLVRRPALNLRRLRELSTFDDSEDRDDVIWALNDVSFEVARGEIVGVIGRNGSGKSTLIKILSRITTPTRGRVELSGRVGALLEVGTAFHPDLTGRENVFLNGSVLGMRKREIEARFDEIVAFSEVEKFIDMPVKRYSTGMALRLAFSVAAHLEAEILLVDEVLAVGDVKFQEKCVGKMQDVTTLGRTVLFVSHNMGSVQRLCDRGILLHDGELLMNGPTREVVSGYLGLGAERLGERVWKEASSAPGDDTARVHAVRVVDDRGALSTEFDVRDPVYVQMEYWVLREVERLNVTLEFRNDRGELLFMSTDDSEDAASPGPGREAGLYRSTCRVPPDLLNNGQMFVLAELTDGVRVHAVRPDVVTFNVLDSMDPAGARGSYPADWPATAVRPRLQWDSERRGETLSEV